MLSNSCSSFTHLALSQPILKALANVGYQTPSPIQSQTIPLLLNGKDVIGQAQTGTGKTAAFALPLLSRVDLNDKNPQVLVLAPTRELAIQVAESFKRYAEFMRGIDVLPIYGGQDYGNQIRQLKKGVQIVVGTPGRVMDHIRRGTLNLNQLNALVLDEADEMLRMGFIDDVEWILEQTPEKRQIALFSATMPAAIRRIAQTYLHQPEEITIQQSITPAESIRQRVLQVKGITKFDALKRILEAETFDGMIIFVRTKNNTTELADALYEQGFAVAALNGDMSQSQRERTVDQLKERKLDILVATDVVARGLDIERISHVINYDAPFNTEAYIHRIGRTGRAGRSGDAILFVNPREKNLLRDIEKAVKKKIEPLTLPTIKQINEQRIQTFFHQVSDNVTHKQATFYKNLITELQSEKGLNAEDIAASLAVMLHQSKPLLLEEKKTKEKKKTSQQKIKADSPKKDNSKPLGKPAEGMLRYRLDVGKQHGVKPGNIVGAIANEAGLDSAYIQKVAIYDLFSTVDLPEGMPRVIYRDLRKSWICGRQLNISLDNENPSKNSGNKPKTKHNKKRAKKG